MVIAFDAKRAYHNTRGLGNYSRDFMRLSAQYAPENRYLLFNPKPQEKNLMPPLMPSQTEIRAEGVWQMLPSVWRSWGCAKQVRGLDADIYHGLSGELPIGLGNRVRKVVTIHDAIFVRYPELYSTTYRHLFLQKVKYACREADLIVAISEQTKQDCIQLFGADEKKIRVIYQGCSNIFRQVADEESKEQVRQRYGLPAQFLLDVGAIEPRKNLKRLLRAMKIAKVYMPLVVVGGRSKYAEQMKQLALQLHLDVVFLHNVDFTHLPAIYQLSHAVVYPSVFEGFGIPILEALCSSVPVLTSTGSCFAETGGDAALYANPQNEEDIADKLSTIIHDQTTRQTLINNAKWQAEKFSDDVVGNNIRQLYLSLC